MLRVLRRGEGQTCRRIGRGVFGMRVREFGSGYLDG